MSNYKRTKVYVGRPALLDPLEPEYRTLWLQPTSENQVPMQVRAYVNREGNWVGWRYTDHTRLEVTWMCGLWKEVPAPFDLQLYQDEDLEVTQEVDDGHNP